MALIACALAVTAGKMASGNRVVTSVPTLTTNTFAEGNRVMATSQSTEFPPAEEWRPVADFPGYEVSNLGDVRSYWRPYGTGKKVLGENPRVLKGTPSPQGYKKYILANEVGQKTVLVHTLVLEAFVGPRPDGMVVCHGPHGGSCNALYNLSWGTQAKNCGEDKRRDSTAQIGERHPGARFTEQDVNEIRRLYRAGVKQTEIARRFGCKQGHISDICLRKIWTCISEPEDAT